MNGTTVVVLDEGDVSSRFFTDEDALGEYLYELEDGYDYTQILSARTLDGNIGVIVLQAPRGVE